ncbi:MAG: hypothetical protein ACK4VO_04295 [Pseudobdellovibrio sp.]
MKKIKNTLKLSALLPLAVLAFQHAEAATYRYKFKVASSGLDIYACNAGVLSQATQLVCVDKKTGRSYVGAEAKLFAESCSTAKGNCQSSIICNQDLGSTFVNGMLGQTISYDSYATGSRNFTEKVAQANTKNVWSTLVSEKDAKNNVLGDLSFMFMTEMYNAKYFVDICIRAPMNLIGKSLSNNFVISQRAADVPLVYTGRKIPGQTNRDGAIVDESLTNYIKKAGVKVDGYIGCDTLDTTGADLNLANVEFITGADGITPVSAGGKEFKASSGLNMMNGSEILIKSTEVQNPIFCKVRYVFTETSLTTFRPNRTEGAEMCTYTEFNDPALQSSTGALEAAK